MAVNAFGGATPPGAITQPPSSYEYLTDRGFWLLAVCGASLIILLVAYILWKIGGQGLPAIYRYHLGFLTSTNWNVQDAKFGILPEIWGTLYSSLLALLIGGFFGLAVAIFLIQDFLPPRVAFVFRSIIDMVPTAAGGIASRMVLGFGRALGETMTLALLIGNSNQISLSLFAPARTLASLLASSFPEAGRGAGSDVRRPGFAGDHVVVNVIGTAILTVTQRRISGRS